MSFLATERRVVEAFLPRLDEALSALNLLELERPDGHAIALYRAHGGPALLVPAELGGKGANPIDAARIHRAIGSRSPSLAAAITMHNFCIAALVASRILGDEGDALLSSISDGQLFVASGNAEGRTGANILSAMTEARPVPGGYRLRGSKKPCSLSRSMDLLTSTVVVPGTNGCPARRALIIVPASSDGIERRPFWNSWVLGGAESDEIVLNDVFIPTECLRFPTDDSALDTTEIAAYVWFELLASASYLGVASGLVERALASGRGSAGDRARLGIELEGAMAAVEGVAYQLVHEGLGEHVVARSLFARFAAQAAVERAVSLAAELMGGMAFVRSSEVAYLIAAARALAFHPPSRTSAEGPLAAYLSGQPLCLL